MTFTLNFYKDVTIFLGLGLNFIIWIRCRIIWDENTCMTAFKQKGSGSGGFCLINIKKQKLF